MHLKHAYCFVKSEPSDEMMMHDIYMLAVCLFSTIKILSPAIFIVSVCLKHYLAEVFPIWTLIKRYDVNLKYNIFALFSMHGLDCIQSQFGKKFADFIKIEKLF